MNVFNQLRIGIRLAAAFTVLVLLMLAIVTVAKIGLSAIGDDIELVVKDRYVKVKNVTDLMDGLNLQARAMRNLLLMDAAAQREDEFKAIDKSRADNSEIYRKLEASVTTPKGKEMLARLQKERAEYVAELDPFLKMVRAGDIAPARAQLFDKLRPQQLEYMKELSAFTAYQEQLMDEASAAATARVDRTSMTMIIAAALGLAIAVAAGLLVTRSVTRPVGEAVATLQAVAQGDLTVDVTVNRADEVGALQRALADTVVALRRVVGEVRSGVDSVTTASSQIAAGNQDLSSRTEQQASSLQETASSMEQLSGTVRQSADNAQQANQLAASASEAASRGGEVVGAVVTTMEDISASSKKIADIIGVIDGIAFQTNILALNAAVEAARAGEQGRGFAVVAGEVRSLAQRSAEAAKEIKSLIGNSVEKVETGSRQVADAGTAMNEIVSQVRRVTDLIGEIASAAQEQSSGISQVNQAVSQMDQVTQQNAALVEESAAAASSLSQQAQKLAEAVAVFKLSHAPSATAAAPTVTPTPVTKATARSASPQPTPSAKPVAGVTAKADVASDGDWTSF